MRGGSGELTAAQYRHWQETYGAHPDMYGMRPSQPGRYAAGLFRTSRASRVLELGAGHGRDALLFADSGMSVIATDFSSKALELLAAHAEDAGLTERIRTLVHDVRDPLPLENASVDAIFAHMLLCMALSTKEIETLIAEIARVLTPGGLLVYTVRNSDDAHYGTGTAHGDNVYEHGGFAVHFFDRALVDNLAQGWHLREVVPFEEGELPRRLWRITQVRTD